MVKCTNCGVEVANNLDYCPSCGTKVEDEVSGSLCPNCGFDVGDSAFCPSCGTKIEDEVSGSLCPNCGFDAGDSKFCQNCGSEMTVEVHKIFCPNCGFDVGDSAFCPNCGTQIMDDNKKSFNYSSKSMGSEKDITPTFDKSTENKESFDYGSKSTESEKGSTSTLDKVIEVDEKVSRKFGKLLSKSKSMDLVYEKTASIRRKNMDQTMDFYARKEPEFLEVYNSIDDDLVKSILALEREKLGSVGGGAIGAAMSSVYIPTKDMDYNESIQFYIDIVNRIVKEINIEKQKGTFDEDEFYKQKYKQSNLENISSAPILKAFKALKK